MTPSDDNHHFAARTLLGARLKGWREKQGYKIATAARALGVSTATWGHWETGHTFPSAEMLLNLCALTELPIQWLFCPHMETCPFQAAGEMPPPGVACCQNAPCVAPEQSPPP